MNDPKDFNEDINDDGFIDLAQDAELVEEDFSLEFDDLYDDTDIGGDLDVAPAEQASADSGSGKLWLILSVGSFALALLLALTLGPAVSAQKQRADQAVEAVSKVNLTSLAAGQAVTRVGRFEPVQRSLDDTELSVNGLSAGAGMSYSIANALFANSEANQQVQNLWTDYKVAVENFIGKQDDVQQMKQRLSQMNGVLAKAVGDSVLFVEAVSKEGRNKSSGTAKDKYLFLTSEASNLNGVLSRLSGSTSGYFSPSADLSKLADAQNGLMVRLQDTLNRIVSNSAAVVGTAAEPLRDQYTDLQSRVLEISDSAVAMTEARGLLNQLRERGVTLSEGVQKASNQDRISGLSNLATIFPITLGLLGAFFLWRYSQTRGGEVVQADEGLEETLADQQEAILKLLDEMSALADGDLTVEAEVTDQITGAIADSVNFAVIEMRELVSQINRASLEVANESELAVSNAQSVSQSNMSQADQISKAANMMQQVSQDMLQMSNQASSSANMASDSLNAAERGAQAVRDTIQGMEDIREQIQDTSKRIKRLGESSQRIGDIVALIDDIAEQTNILSLNAAIQASMAGEAGRGFAVVSDEVQSLAERSTEATKKIAELVTTIQNDTNDAVLSMEKATQQVVGGTRVADSAGKALAEIERVSKGLSEVVEQISTGSNQHAETVSQVSEQVVDVSDSSTETSHKAQESANSIAKLLELAKELETSVSRFKLPAA